MNRHLIRIILCMAGHVNPSHFRATSRRQYHEFDCKSRKFGLISYPPQEDVRKAWQKLANQYNLEKDAFEKATWGYGAHKRHTDPLLCLLTDAQDQISGLRPRKEL